MTQSPQPKSFNIDDSALVILDKAKNELWRYETEQPDLKDQSYNEGHFQKRLKLQEGVSLPFLIIKDINNDGKIEVLFTIKTENSLGEGTIFCFNNKGGRIWEFHTGRQLKFGQKIYSADYKLWGFNIHDINHDGQYEIVAISSQFSYFPCQLIVLNSEGKLFGEFWNSGHLRDFAFTDLNQDGRDEIVAVGMNNEYERGCVLAFDSFAIDGASPQLKDYFISRDLQPGTELFYALLPRTEIDIDVPYPGDTVEYIDVLSGGRFRIYTCLSGIYYEFDKNLAFQDARKSPSFESKWKAAVASGKASALPEPQYWADLLRKIEYWNGNGWSDNHIINRTLIDTQLNTTKTVSLLPKTAF